jgi:hypothetical protein
MIMPLKILVLLTFILSSCNYPEDDWQADSNEVFFTWVKTIYYDVERDTTVVITPMNWSETYHFTLKFQNNDRYARFYKGEELLLETKFYDTHILYEHEMICDEYDFCYDFEDRFTICTADGDSNGIRLIGLPWIERQFSDDCRTFSYFREVREQ